MGVFLWSSTKRRWPIPEDRADEAENTSGLASWEGFWLGAKMSPRSNEIVILVTVLALALVLAAVGWFRFFTLRLKVAYAEDQTRYFVEVLELSYESRTADEVRTDMRAVTNYYHSGSWQRKGSALDIIVERTRELVLDRIALELTNRIASELTNSPAKAGTEKLE